MKHIIILFMLCIAFIACEKQLLPPQVTQTISHDSIIYNLKNFIYTPYNNTYERGVVGKVLFDMNSMVVDSTTVADSAYCYASFNLEVDYDHNQQQLINDIANGTSGYIPYVDTPTHIIILSKKWSSTLTSSSGTHLAVFDPHIADPIWDIKFTGNGGEMESSNAVQIRIARIKKTQLNQSCLDWATYQFDHISQSFGNSKFKLSAINVKRGHYFSYVGWQTNF